MSKLVSGASGRHVEIMRGGWPAILYEATRDDVSTCSGTRIRTIDQQPDGVAVTFEHAPADRFDVVVGADGLHSEVRRLAFGPEPVPPLHGRVPGGQHAPQLPQLDGRMVI